MKRIKILLGTILFTLLAIGTVYATTDTIGAVTIADSATEIIGRTPYRTKIVIYNNGTEDVYLGFSSGVTKDNGLPLPASTYVTIQGKGEKIFGIVTTGTEEVRYWEEKR